MAAASIEIEARRKIAEIPAETVLAPVKIDNETLAQYLNSKIGSELTAEKISHVTGIDFRYRMQPLGEKPEPIHRTIPRLSKEIALNLIEKSHIDPSCIDYVFVCTSYPFGKSAAQEVATYIEADCPAIDVYGACTGPGFLLNRLHQIPELKEPTNILLICAEHYSAKMKPDDRDISIFSDGATAVLLKLGSDFQIIDSDYNFYPSDAIKMPIDYHLIPPGSLAINCISNQTQYFDMDGHTVYRWFVEGTPIQKVVEMHDQVALNKPGNTYIIPHQGSGRIVQALEKVIRKAGVQAPISSLTVKNIGNLASGSAVAEFAALTHDQKVQINREDIILFSFFGAGFAQANIALKALRQLN